MPWVFGLVLKWHYNSEFLPSEMHLQNSLTKRNFKAESWISKQKFAQKRRISRSYCSGPRDRSNQLAEGPHQSEIKYGYKMSSSMKNWIWWWRQNWNGATTLSIWPTKLPTVEPWQDKRAKKSYTDMKTEECFQRKTFGYCSRRDACIFYTRMPREIVRTTWIEVEIRKKFRASILFSTESEETDWRKSLNSQKASPATKAKNSLVVVGKMNKIVVRPPTSSRVSWLQVWKQMHLWMSLRMSTSWWWKETKVLKDQLLFWKKKTSKVVYLKTQIQSILFYGRLKNWDWTLRRDTPEILRMHLVQNLNSGKKRTLWWYNPKRRTSWAKSLRAQFWEETPEETSRQADCTSKVAWNLARKYASSKPNSCEGARDIEDRMFGMDSGASMHNAEQGDLRSDTMDTLRRSKKTHERVTATVGQCK